LGLSRINQVALREPEGMRSVALVSIGSDDPDVRFASAYALALTGIEVGDADVVRPLLDADDARLRLLAAQTLAAVGVGDGVPVLISLLGSDDQLRDGLRVWQVARRTLLDLAGQDLGLVAATDMMTAAATIHDWEAWWQSAKGSFTPVARRPVFG
jgi:HEAT repeat protein